MPERSFTSGKRLTSRASIRCERHQTELFPSMSGLHVGCGYRPLGTQVGVFFLTARLCQAKAPQDNGY